MGRNDISTTIKAIKGNMVVTAGAGTGKTTCLVEKVITLIGEAYIPVEKILAITFTKAAAAEMVERLRVEIGKRAKTEMGEVWKIALNDLERAQISTIHSLCARILRENPIEAGIDPDFKEEEETINILLTEEIWDAWAKENLWGGHEYDDDLVTLIKRFGTEGIKAIGMELSKRPDRIDDYLRYRVDGEAERKEFQKLLAKIRDELSGSDIEAKEEDLLYQKCIKTTEILAKNSLEEMADSLNGVDSRRVVGREENWASADTFTSVKEMFYQPGGVIDTLKELKPFLKQLEDDKIAETAVRVMSGFVRFIREERIGRGVLTFFDLIYEAKRLLQKNLEVRRRYQREFDYILVDEFQDTDPIQGDIILFLAEDGAKAERPEDVKVGGDRLFIVGDPKQSIFRFREAEIGVFYDVADKIKISGGEKQELANSYRSQKHLVEFHNALFSSYIGYEEERYAVDYDPLTPRIEDIPNIDGESAVDIVISNSTGGGLADEVREEEAEYIATRILDMVEGQAEGKIVRDKETKEPRAVKYGDIAILIRTMTSVSIYEEALKRENIPYIIVGGRGYYQRQEISDLINILSVVLDPTDKRALVGVLRSSVFGIDDETIYRLAEGDKLNYRVKAGDDRVEKAYKVLRHLHRIRGGRTLSGLLDEVFDRTEIMEINGFGTGGTQRVGNLTKIGKIAMELESAGPVTLTSFIHLLREFVESDPDEGEAVITEEVEDSVRIMTVHKAKGLEFPVVFLPNLGSKLKLDPRGGIYVDTTSKGTISGVNLKTKRKRLMSDLGYNMYLKERERQRNLAEERRIFYVATTRARDRLILLGKKDVPTDNLMKDIRGFLGVDEREWPKFRCRLVPLKKPEEGQKTAVKRKRQKMSDFTIGGGNTREIKEARDRERNRQEEYKRALDTALYGSVTGEAKDVSEAFRGVDSYVDGSFEGEGRGRMFAGGTGPMPPAGDVPLLVGSLLHAALEGIDFAEPPKGDGVKELVQRASISLQIGDDIRDEVASETVALVKKFLASDAAKEIASSEIIGSEVPVITSKGEKTLVGRIDLIYGRDGEIVVLDYKTDNVGAGSEKEAAEKYRSQMETYVKAVASAMGEKAEGRSIRGVVHFVRTGVTAPVFTMG
ncbi:MAG: UvrD-helicase domain-containing protein [Deltaproteobacteria bacterium]|uniref:DNA 3'-5' helicase n=1 Tax=Candidatus Zymogenus saltonus TaxID=2844893 RepID=A0A9D8PIQ1_9DELT|nr:UvrD-helicase domain-containing protein [Candidatus Zymogenus saltonus]